MQNIEHDDSVDVSFTCITSYINLGRREFNWMAVRLILQQCYMNLKLGHVDTLIVVNVVE